MLHAKKPTSYWFGDSSELITSFFSQAAPVLASSFPTEVPAASWGHHQWHPAQNAAEEQWPLVARGLWPGFSVVSVVFPVLRNGIWTENQIIQIDPNLMFFRCRCERYRSCTRQHVSWHFMTFMTFHDIHDIHDIHDTSQHVSNSVSGWRTLRIDRESCTSSMVSSAFWSKACGDSQGPATCHIDTVWHTMNQCSLPPMKINI